MTAFNTDANNRQLHPSEQKKARELYELAKKKGLPYTLADIEDALRTADHKGETIATNIIVNPATPAGFNDRSATDMYAGKVEDPMIPGQTTNASQPWVTNGDGTLIQNFRAGGGQGAFGGFGGLHRQQQQRL